MGSIKTTTTLILAAMVIAIIGSTHACAQVSISLPDQGEYHVGQFMPVDVVVDDVARDQTVVLAAPGALTTTVELRGESRVRVPVLMISNNPGRLHWSVVGGASGQLDPPLTAVPAAADSVSALGGTEAYAPTVGWNPGTSARVRRVLILSAILMSLLLLGSVTLLRGRVAVAGVVLLVAIGALAFEFGRRAVSPIWRAEGQIIVVSANGTAQFDTWQYVTARSASDVTCELPQDAVPVFVDSQHARDMQASLHLDAARKILSIRCKLGPQVKLAVLQRRTTPAATPLPSTQPIARSIRSPMGALARYVYANRDVRVVDEGSVEWTDDQLVHWPSVILWRER